MGCPSEVYIGDSLVFSICTHDPDTGVLTDAGSAPSYWVYEDENATEILSGSMAKFDSKTGHYTELIACTAVKGFEVSKTYTIFINATVDSDTGGISYAFKTSALTAAQAALLAASAGTIVSGTTSDDNTSATTTVFYSDDVNHAVTDHYKNRIVIFTGGNLQNQMKDITAYSKEAGEGKFTVTALTAAPNDNSTFILV